jgi:hypothetical protein
VIEVCPAAAPVTQSAEAAREVPLLDNFWD